MRNIFHFELFIYFFKKNMQPHGDGADDGGVWQGEYYAETPQLQK